MTTAEALLERTNQESPVVQVRRLDLGGMEQAVEQANRRELSRLRRQFADLGYETAADGDVVGFGQRETAPSVVVTEHRSGRRPKRS